MAVYINPNIYVLLAPTNGETNHMLCTLYVNGVRKLSAPIANDMKSIVKWAKKQA